MRIAIPLAADQVAEHFGQSTHAAIFDLDDKGAVLAKRTIEMPPHTPGALPARLATENLDLVLTGSIGQRAIMVLAEAGVRVVAGVIGKDPQRMIEELVTGQLLVRHNGCGNHGCGGHDHDHSHDHGHSHSHGHDHSHDGDDDLGPGCGTSCGTACGN